jgi:uncharacterized phosphosugar-binding protein
VSAASEYLLEAEALVRRVRETQLEAIEAAADVCAAAIVADGLVHLFGTGHSRVLVEEMYPRYGSFPGFHPIVELSLTNHAQVVGANGQRQAMFLERVSGFAEVILANFELRPEDVMVVFSSGGENAVPVEIAEGAKRRGLTVIAVTTSRDSSLARAADLVIENGSVPGDALVRIEGLETPVAPGSTVGGAAVVNALKAGVAERLVARGAMPPVITSEALVGAERSRELFEASYREYRRRVRRL